MFATRAFDTFRSGTATSWARTLVLGVLVVVAHPLEARAYLDPASGSMLLQTLVAGILAGAFILKSQWRHLKSRFVTRRAGGDDPPSTGPGSDDEQR